MSNEVILKAMKDAFSMTKQRCYNPKSRDYHYYGGRGIRIHQPWLDDFSQFVKDMGLRPDGHTLERVENDKDYCPSNCVWATRLDQMSNTRKAKAVTYNGVTKSVSQWERHLGFKPGVLKARLNRLGYSIDEAFTKEVKCGLVREGAERAPRAPPENLDHVPRGLQHYETKFSVVQVIEIRSKRSDGQTVRSLASEFGTSATTVTSVCNRRGAYKEI